MIKFILLDFVVLICTAVRIIPYMPFILMALTTTTCLYSDEGKRGGPMGRTRWHMYI